VTVSTMRIPVRLVIEVDADAWRKANGIPDARARDVAADVRSYVLNAVQQLPMLADECAGLAFPAQR
jgi:hypothetical protein